MLPIAVWYFASAGPPWPAQPCAATGHPLRRLIGESLIRLGRALSGPDRASESTLVPGSLAR